MDKNFQNWTKIDILRKKSLRLTLHSKGQIEKLKIKQKKKYLNRAYWSRAYIYIYLPERKQWLSTINPTANIDSICNKISAATVGTYYT